MQYKMKNTKHKLANILFWVIMIIIGILPLLLSSVFCYLKVLPVLKNLSDTDFLLAMLPISFSIIIVVNNGRVEYINKKKKEKKQEVELFNGIVKNYNKILLITSDNYHLLNNEFFRINKSLEYIKDNPFFNEIIVYWEENIKQDCEIVIDNNFNSILRIKLYEFINYYRKRQDFDHNLELLNSLSPVFSNYYKYTTKDRVFIYNLRDYISFSEKEKDIIDVHANLFASGDYRDKACCEFKIAIEKINKCFENEVQTRIINDKKFHILLSSLLINIFGYLGIHLRMIYFNELFTNLLVNKLNEYYKLWKDEHNELIEYIKTEPIRRDPYFDKLVNEEVINRFYKIGEV